MSKYKERFNHSRKPSRWPVLYTLQLPPKVITSLFWFCHLSMYYHTVADLPIKNWYLLSLLIYRFILHSRLCLIVCWRTGYFTKVSCSLDFFDCILNVVQHVYPPIFPEHWQLDPGAWSDSDLVQWTRYIWLCFWLLADLDTNCLKSFVVGHKKAGALSFH